MKVAVTGGLGLIGTVLTRKLIEHGHDVTAIDIRRSQAPGGARLHIADVTDLDQIGQALSDVEAVYHLAGTVLHASRKNPHLAVCLDILGTANILEASIKNGVEKVIYASSFYAYDGLPKSLQVAESECSDIFKAEMFGVVKLVGERLILEYNHRYGLKYGILRYGPVYGPSDRCTCVIHDFINTGLRREPLIIWGRGERKNQYTYVEDIADGSLAVLRFENEIFNLISPEQVTIRQIAELLAEKYGFKVEYDLSKHEGPSLPYISPKKAIEKLGWRPISLEKGIEKVIEALALTSTLRI
ncbi:MAG: NAD-dependent epimerase/dehydratase family protein [Candidatus Bathyarchaeia archaeon]